MKAKNMSSSPNVFIIESLTLKDETFQRFEGRILSKILHLAGIDSQYYYVRTEHEFEKIISIFIKSNYRYLRISCHGTDNALWTTLDRISFKRLRNLLGNALDGKRLFISACSATNSRLADALLCNTKCLSVIGPSEDILFDEATIFWASFYQLMFKKNNNRMSRSSIQEILSKLSSVHELAVSYFASSKSSRAGWQEIVIGH